MISPYRHVQLHFSISCNYLFDYSWLSVQLFIPSQRYYWHAVRQPHGSKMVIWLQDSMQNHKKNHYPWLWDSIYDSNQITFYFAVVEQQNCMPLYVNKFQFWLTDGLDKKLRDKDDGIHTGGEYEYLFWSNSCWVTLDQSGGLIHH